MRGIHLPTLYICLFFYIETCSAKEILPVGVAIFPPFQYLENNVLVGSDTEILTQVLDDIGFIPDFHVRPWKRIQAEAKLGNYALIFSLTENKQRTDDFYLSDPINSVRDVFFKRKDRQIHWETLVDVAHLTISASDGYNYANSFLFASKNIFSKISWVRGVLPEIKHLEKLQSGLVDIAICEINVCLHLIRKQPDRFDQVDYIDKTIGPIRQFHVGISKYWPNSQKLLNDFNKSLKKFIASGKRDEIFQKYGFITVDQN